MQNHNDAMIRNEDERHSSMENLPLTLFERVACERELETEENCNILTSPAPPDLAVCLSRSPGLLNRRPGDPALCWVLFSLQHHFQVLLCITNNQLNISHLFTHRAI